MRAIHPGEVLREEFLIPMKLSAHALAIALHVPAPRINDIVRERRAVSADTAMRLARFFSTGKVSNVELEGLIHRNMAAIEQAFVSARYVEVTRSTLIVHE
jgi:addiction module HigA family antidote